MFQKYKTNLKQLNLPEYSFRFAGKEGAEMIFDPVRRKWVRLTPEEWVRQNFVQYLINEGSYPAGLIVIEKSFTYNRLKRRADIVIYNRNGKPVMIIECKSSETKIIDNEIIDQVANYNREFSVPYFLVTNGIIHLAFKINPLSNMPEYLDVIPRYEDLLT
jgi:hypothetical protein